eukprot:Tbor_TRINITY_DN5261_c4_g3::TRINITY_DN5261_c4_g3_i1::g.16149::m.16149/K20183/VPS39, VAM6; Vam6/Vps39-like protein vacuolar protein sorting-associated protein 39
MNNADNKYNFFSVTNVLSKTDNIKCVAACENLFFLGSDMVKVYEIIRTPNGPITSRMRYTGLKTSQKNQIKKISVIPDENVMILLIEDQVVMYDIPPIAGFREDVDVSRIRERQAIVSNCIDYHIKKDGGMYHLAMSLDSKKIIFAEMKDRSIGFVKSGRAELSLPEKVMTLCWVENILTVGCKQMYMFFENQNAIDIKACKVYGKPLVCPLGNRGEVILCSELSGPRFNSKLKPDTGCVWNSPPIDIGMMDPYVLAAEKEGTMTSVAVHAPFWQVSGSSLVKNLPIKNASFISVPSYVDYDAKGLSDARRRKDITIIADSSASVYLVEMKPIVDQLTELIKSRNLSDFETALQMCHYCRDEISESNIREVKKKYALFLAENAGNKEKEGKGNRDMGGGGDSLVRNLKRAFNLLYEASIDPTYAIALFPGFLLEKVRKEFSTKVSPMEVKLLTDYKGTCLEALVNYLEKIRSDSARIEAEADTAASSGGKVTGKSRGMPNSTKVNVDTALLQCYLQLDRPEDRIISFLVNENYCDVLTSSSLLKAHQQWIALVYLMKKDEVCGLSDILKSMRNLAFFGRDMNEWDDGNNNNNMDFSMICSPLSKKHLLTADGTLLKDVFPFIKRRDLITSKLKGTEEIKAMLMNVYETMYIHNGRVLDDNEKEIISNQVVGITATLTILRNELSFDSNSKTRKLHKEMAPWVLAHLHPAISITLFTEVNTVKPHDIPSVFPPALVLETLEKIGDNVPVSSNARCVEYLEYLLRNSATGDNNSCGRPLDATGSGCVRWDSEITDSELYQNKLINLLICQVVKQITKEGQNSYQGSGDVGDQGQVKKINKKILADSQGKLRNYLFRLNHYSSSSVLLWLKEHATTCGFFHERAIIYRKMKMHEEAIDMYITEVEDKEEGMQEAKHYAFIISNEDKEDAFQILLDRAPVSAAVDIVRTCQGVHALSALPKLPDETSLSDLGEFLKSVLRESRNDRRNLEVQAALSRTRLRNIEIRLQTKRSHYSFIDNNAVCCKCKFGIKDSIFATFPNGDKAHQLCFESDHIHPVTKEDFRGGIQSIYHAQ